MTTAAASQNYELIAQDPTGHDSNDVLVCGLKHRLGQADDPVRSALRVLGRFACDEAGRVIPKLVDHDFVLKLAEAIAHNRSRGRELRVGAITMLRDARKYIQCAEQEQLPKVRGYTGVGRKPKVYVVSYA